METKEITRKLICLSGEKQYIKLANMGIIPYKDSNDFLYFEEGANPGLIEGPHGIDGFEQIQAMKDFIKCKRHDGLWYIYLRKNKRWLAYQNNGPTSELNYHFYGDGVVYYDDSLLQVIVENCNTGLYKEFAIYLLDEDRFVKDLTYTGHLCGIFEPLGYDLEIEKRTLCGVEKRTLLLNRKRHDDRNPFALYLVDTDEFFTVPFPEEFQGATKTEQKMPRFYYICEKYAVLQLRNQKTYKDNFYLYDITQQKYLNFDKEHTKNLDEKYWRPQQMLCAQDKVCIQYNTASAKSETYWEILSTEDWKPIELPFEHKVTTTIFKSVSVDPIAEIITIGVGMPETIYQQI